MKANRRVMSHIALVVLIACGVAAESTFAAATAPCTPVPAFPDMEIVPLRNAEATYCVSDFGWSDAWFVGSAPAAYDPRLDVLSGDDAPNLHFGIVGGLPWLAASGFGWISPVLDGGTLNPERLTGSTWTVIEAVHFTDGTTTTQSIVRHPLGMELEITTSLALAGQEITQTFLLTNRTIADTFEDIVLADYFNFHPNGSTAENARKGTMTYSPAAGLRVTGPDDGTLIAAGSMRGERADDFHGTNALFVSVPDIALDMVQTLTFPGPGLPDAAFTAGPGDAAGGLAWRLEDLTPGASVRFSIFKLAEPLASVPSPGSGACVAVLVGCILLRRRRGTARGAISTSSADPPRHRTPPR